MSPSSIALRTACAADIPELQVLVQQAIVELLAPFLSATQLQGSLEIMGLDTQLIIYGTYFIAKMDGALVGCGGWSRRAAHFGGDHPPDRDAGLLSPARVRAMYTRPAFARRGIARAVLRHCEEGASGGLRQRQTGRHFGGHTVVCSLRLSRTATPGRDRTARHSRSARRDA